MHSRLQVLVLLVQLLVLSLWTPSLPPRPPRRRQEGQVLGNWLQYALTSMRLACFLGTVPGWLESRHLVWSSAGTGR